MANFASIGKSLVKFNFDKVIFSYFNEKKVQDAIIRTIRIRLFQKGVEKDGRAISTDIGNPYAYLTKKYKSEGVTYRDGKEIFTGVRPINRVTLLSEGHLYASMKAEVTKNQLLLVANFDDSKYKGGIFKNFQNSFANKTEFRAEVMSLTESEIDKIIQNLIKGIIQEMKNKI